MKSMDLSQLRLDIKRTNTRISTIAKEFGVNSPVYQEAIKGYEEGYSGFTHLSSSGALQLNVGQLTRQYKDTDKPQGLESQFLLKARLSKTPTLTQIYSRGADQLGVDYKDFKKLTKTEMKTLIEQLTVIESDFKRTYEMFYSMATEDVISDVMEEMRGNDGDVSYTTLERKTKEMQQALEKLNQVPTPKGNVTNNKVIGK